MGAELTDTTDNISPSLLLPNGIDQLLSETRLDPETVASVIDICQSLSSRAIQKPLR